MTFVGIDISKYKHDCFIVNDLGEVIEPVFSFENNASGVAKLSSALDKIKDEKRIGFEATGHYGLNLKHFLITSGNSFMEINPVLIKKYIQSHSLRRTKTDKLDATIIASYLSSVEFKPYPASLYHTFSLKSLTRLRDRLIRQRSGYKVRLTNVLDIIFPEFKPFFNNRFSTTALYILANYPSPEKIANMNVRSYDTLRRISRGKFSMPQFVQLKHLAKNTVGNSDDIMCFELNTLLELYSQLDSKIEDTEQKIAALIREIDPPMLSIPGVGVMSAAVILSEYGSISNFSTVSRMLAFAGLEPGVHESGTEANNGKMVKHGSAHLRYAILNCCTPVMLYNEVFAEYYYKKIAEGKPHGVAMSHVAKKLLRLIFTLETRNIKFDPEKLR